MRLRAPFCAVLQIGTLNSLMDLLDELGKMDIYVESVVKKIARQATDLAGTSSAAAQLTVEHHTPSEYVRSFQWDTSRYPLGVFPPEHVEAIRRLVMRIDEQLKARYADLHEARSKLQHMTRKATGTLAARSLVDVVNPADVINSEYLATVFVCVKAVDAAEFLRVHETLVECTDYETMERFSAIVPRETKKVASDEEFAVFAVYVLKKMADDFRRECLQRKFVVRELAGAAGMTEDASGATPDANDTRESLEADVAEKMQKLAQWCLTNFGETFVAMTHLKMVRVFVESVLRFGLPADFAVVLVEPKAKAEKKVRALLKSTFASLSSAMIDGADAPDEGGAVTGADGIFYPYVCVEVAYHV